jgi:cytochrome c
MKHVDLAWTEATLDLWLRDPAGLIPDTTMRFPGLRDSKARQDVIAYLKSVSEGKAPARVERGGMIMNMQPVKEDLKKAPPQGQLTPISHCGKPVLVGAGMQGDRASVVFASPSEISTFIRAECSERK